MAIAHIVRALTDIRSVIRDADAADKARIYHELGLRLTYEPAKHNVQAQLILDPDRGVVVRVRGGIASPTPLAPLVITADLAIR